MRILVVTNMYPPHHFGGYELSCADAVRRFRRAGHQVTVLTSTVRVAGAGADEPGVRRELTIYWRDHQIVSPPVPERVGIEVGNRRVLGRALAETDPDVVSVWNMGAMSLGLLAVLREANRPVVFVMGDDWPDYAPHLDAWSRLWRGRVGRRAGRLLTWFSGLPTTAGDYSDLGPSLWNSRAMLEQVAAGGRWAMPDRAVVYVGVEADDFPVAPAEAPVGDRPWAGRLLYVGRLDRRKGVDTVVRALADLPDCELRVIGRGDEDYRADLVRLAADLDVTERVTFSEAARSELRGAYGAADVLVFPSVYAEPFGIVPLEAMACDTPVVGTGTGGSGEYLLDGWNCLRYPPGDAAALAECLRRMAADAGLRASLVRNGRRTAAELTTEAWMRSLLAWHEAARDRFRHGRPPNRDLSRLVTEGSRVPRGGCATLPIRE